MKPRSLSAEQFAEIFPSSETIQSEIATLKADRELLKAIYHYAQQQNTPMMEALILHYQKTHENEDDRLQAYTAAFQGLLNSTDYHDEATCLKALALITDPTIRHAIASITTPVARIESFSLADDKEKSRATPRDLLEKAAAINTCIHTHQCSYQQALKWINASQAKVTNLQPTDADIPPPSGFYKYAIKFLALFTDTPGNVAHSATTQQELQSNKRNQPN